METPCIHAPHKKTRTSVELWGVIATFSILNALFFGFAQLQETHETLLNAGWYFLLLSHITHTDWIHLASNVMALRLLIEIFTLRLVDQCIALLIAFLSVNTLLIITDVYSYAGLSGIIYGVPGLYIGIQMRQKQWLYGVNMTVLFLAYMFIISPLDVMSINEDYVPFQAAHMVGYFSALLVGFYFKPTKFREDKA